MLKSLVEHRLPAAPLSPQHSPSRPRNMVLDTFFRQLRINLPTGSITLPSAAILDTVNANIPLYDASIANTSRSSVVNNSISSVASTSGEASSQVTHSTVSVRKPCPVIHTFPANSIVSTTGVKVKSRYLNHTYRVISLKVKIYTYLIDTADETDTLFNKVDTSLSLVPLPIL